MNPSRTDHDSNTVGVDDDGVADRTPTPGNEEFPELKKPKFGWARYNLAGLALIATLSAAFGVVLLAMGEPVGGAIMLGGGVLVLLASWAWHRKMKRIERDPSAHNPQDNPVNRFLLRLRRDHPVVYGLLYVALLVLFAYTLYLKWMN